MNKRIASIAAIACLAVFSCLALAGCSTEGMDDGMRSNLGLALGILIIAASGLGFLVQGRYFGRKRHRNQQKNRRRAQQKKKKRK